MKEIHTATHPAPKLERRERDGRDADDEPEADAAEVLARLDEEAEEDGDA